MRRRLVIAAVATATLVLIALAVTAAGLVVVTKHVERSARYRSGVDYRFLPRVLSDDDIRVVNKCFAQHDCSCFSPAQRLVLAKVRARLGKQWDRMHVEFARWSSGVHRGAVSPNYSAQAFHRDVKPTLRGGASSRPPVYTLIVFLDHAMHQQGTTHFRARPGDCLLFNAHNLHRGLPSPSRTQSQSPRRVLQFFNVTRTPQERVAFERQHAFAEYPTNAIADVFLRNANRAIDLRAASEYYNCVPMLLRLRLPSHVRCVTLYRPNTYIGTCDGVRYYANV